MNSDLGDFQTPPGLVAAVLQRLESLGTRWTRVLEPTCGRGNFLAPLLKLDAPPREILGIELQPAHLAAARVVTQEAPRSVRVRLIEASVFDMDLTPAALDWQDAGPLLVVGNPPWVTSAALGALESGNGPKRVNLKGIRGIDALTGSSNFDIAEAVWLKLLTALGDEAATIALLCKTSVARSVIEHAARLKRPVADVSVTKIDAKRWFGASVDACLLCIVLGAPGPALERIPVFEGLDATEPLGAMGFARGQLVADLDAYARFAAVDGAGPLVWRQGLKHDAAGLMELTGDEKTGTLLNKQGEPIDVEPEAVFPLLKGTDLSRPRPIAATRRVIVTQRTMSDDTGRLNRDAPALWAYLQTHAATFARRKSSIYRNRPPFAMFGIGPYSFAPYKVAVSGLHKAPVFHAVGPVAGRPVMLDDTGYFLPCQRAEQAALTAELLNGPEALGLLRALAFPGAKRPVTKAALQRIDLHALLGRADRPGLLARAGAEVVRLAARPANWPESLESLLEPEPVFINP